MNRVKGGARSIRLLMIAGAVLLSFASEAAAQCVITGPSVLCGGTAQLCGPSGNYEYMWSGPNGFGDWQQCITVTVPGAYELTLLDLDAWSYAGPCTVLVTDFPPSPSITGPGTFCGGQTVQLCGPAGESEYEWTGPAGFTAATECVTVGASGTYSLRVRGAAACWSAPGDFVLAVDNPTSPTITGVDSVCTGQWTQLSGPAGLAEYLWSGPGGFSAATSAINVSTAGTYGLAGRASGSTCWSAPSQFVVRQGSCVTEPPPPPPTARPSCPRPASWWARECRVENPNGERFVGFGLSTIGACVDGRAGLFTWVDPRDGLCRAMRERHSLSQRARRHYAAVLANVCAFTTEVQQNGPMPVGLDPNAVLHNPEAAAGTVGQWLAQTDAAIARLDASHQQKSAVRKEYRRIIRVGWAISHGIGVGSVCGHPEESVDDHDARTAGSFDLQAADEDYVDDETLAEELTIEGGMGTLEIESAAPNPFAVSTRLRYYVADTGGQSVELGIYDLSGRLIRKLVSGSVPVGPHSVTWDGRADDGRGVQNGVYFVHGRVGGDRVSSTLTLVR